jgi:hypothetical protein
MPLNWSVSQTLLVAMVGGYFVVGALVGFWSLGRDEIQMEMGNTDFSKHRPWKRKTFLIVLCVGAILLWPFLVAHALKESGRGIGMPEWLTSRGRAVRAARAFAKTRDRIDERPNHVDYSDKDGYWYISFNILPELRAGVVTLRNPTPVCNVKVDSKSNTASDWHRDMSGWL